MDALTARAGAVHWANVGFTAVSGAWGYAGRVVPDQILYFPTRHRMLGEIAGDSFVLAPGELLLTDAGVRHSFRNADREHPIEVFHFRFQIRLGDRLQRLGAPYRKVHQAEHLRPFLEALLREFQQDQPFTLARRQALLATVLIEAGRCPLTGAQGAALPPIQRERLEAAAVERAYRMRPAELAGVVRLNPDYFRVVFRRTYGKSPRQWLAERRLDSSAELLRETDLNVSEIADAAGFPDLFQFSRRFRKCHGLSPTAYRAAHRNAPRARRVET